MNIQTFKVNALEVNCYVVSDDTNEGVIIDCGCSTESEWLKVKRYLDDNGIKVKHLLDTHLHFDHVWGNPYVARDLNLNPEASAFDIPQYEKMKEMVKQVFGINIRFENMPPVGRQLKEGDTVEFGHSSFTVFNTPGHTKGCICFYSEKEKTLFSGDTLFQGSIGRTDLPGGSMDEILTSLRRLITLPEDTKVLCGHGPETTIGYEKRYNMYL